jgi:Fur family peroxide stress response transcriptional regulator
MSVKEMVEKQVSDFVETCKARGLKVTHQRMEILRELASTDEHPDADTIYKGVKKRIPSISLDTVYRTLRMFEEMGVISRVDSLKDRARYDANIEDHYHFVCSRCGIVQDFYSNALDHFRPSTSVAKLGRVDSVYVELRGLCRKCQRKK